MPVTYWSGALGRCAYLCYVATAIVKLIYKYSRINVGVLKSILNTKLAMPSFLTPINLE